MNIVKLLGIKNKEDIISNLIVGLVNWRKHLESHLLKGLLI